MGKREDELKKEGWEKQFTTEEPRLSEAVELYESLGYEVHLEPASSKDMDDECSICIKEMPDRYKTIYTRFKEE
jgi:hypothetical protein